MSQPATRNLAVLMTDIKWKHALTRAIISLVSGYGLSLGYLWAFWEKDRRGWHDLLAGTVVVRR
ncbi:MAG: RDD family protein [Elusimicrobia bacterium]|nr:RDD family protein [Elusimicrobiota bacterium]